MLLVCAGDGSVRVALQQKKRAAGLGGSSHDGCMIDGVLTADSPGPGSLLFRVRCVQNVKSLSQRDHLQPSFGRILAERVKKSLLSDDILV